MTPKLSNDDRQKTIRLLCDITKRISRYDLRREVVAFKMSAYASNSSRRYVYQDIHNSILILIQYLKKHRETLSEKTGVYGYTSAAKKRKFAASTKRKRKVK